MKIVRWIIRLVAGPVLGISAFLLTFALLNRTSPSWESSLGVPVPAEFRYMMFPVHPERSILRSRADGSTTRLARALLNTQEEVNAGAAVHVNSPGSKELEVDLPELGYLQPAESGIGYIQALEADLRARGSYIRGLRYQVSQRGGQTVATLAYIDAMDTFRFEYETDGRTAVPKRMWHESVASTDSVFAFLWATVAGLVVLAVVVRVTNKPARR